VAGEGGGGGEGGVAGGEGSGSFGLPEANGFFSDQAVVARGEIQKEGCRNSVWVDGGKILEMTPRGKFIPVRFEMLVPASSLLVIHLRCPSDIRSDMFSSILRL
jgi:hypothetical protein